MNLDNEHEAQMVDELLKNQCKDFQPNIIGMRYSSSFLRVPQKGDQQSEIFKALKMGASYSI